MEGQGKYEGGGEGNRVNEGGGGYQLLHLYFSLPREIKLDSSVFSFKNQIKIYLFRRASEPVTNCLYGWHCNIRPKNFR